MLNFKESDQLIKLRERAIAAYKTDPFVKTQKLMTSWGRKAVIYQLYESGMGVVQISKTIGYAGHGSVCISIAQHETYMKSDKKYIEFYTKFLNT